MNLFDLFKGKAKDIAVSGSSLGTMNRTDSRPSPNQLAPAATSWADTALNAGRALRGAVERGDIETAKAAFAKRADAMDRARGYDGTDGFIVFDALGVELAKSFPEPETVGFTGDRAAEARQAIALSVALGAPGGDAVLAVLLGAPLPAWEQFRREKASWVSSGLRPRLWASALIDGEPDMSWQPESLAHLTFDARQVLALPKLVSRRMAVTRRSLAERTLLPDDRLESALAELVSAGLAAPPNLADRMAILTIDQLKTMLGTFGIAPRGTKPAIVKAGCELPANEVVARLAEDYPAALEPELTVGLGVNKSAKWLADYAELMAHWLGSSLTTARLHATQGPHPAEIFRSDDCEACRHPARAVPPFHIGCTCSWL